ncbi:MAG TPA: fused MFS/spermidine synthase [Streptosporangiaceae bacterium]|jgi:predicted O-methyltransferase YrrM|nr:fused MFS/spermidine synthase [Streptosporangiaceae bacterium]
MSRGVRRLAVHREVDGGLAELVPDLDRPGSWLLYLGDAPQSQVDLDDPTYLEFEYIQRIAHLLDVIAPAGAPLRVLHLGGGALTLPRYVAATRPGSSQLVAERDAALMDLIREYLPLGPARRRIRVRIGDAREVLAAVAPGRYDVVISDVFAGARTPPHLTTVEFAELAARALAPDGMLVQNVADGPPLAFAKQQVATVASVFPYGLMIAEPGVLRRRRFGNLVLAGRRCELPAAELRRRAAADAFPARVLDGEELDRFVAGTRPATDATAQPSPVPPPAVLSGPAGVDQAQS